uniref:Homeobox protein knotted-1 n=1 Tax=Rhizophora mucronata TaxID=61149 RepID=A0A2P2K0Z6_RHIMU
MKNKRAPLAFYLECIINVHALITTCANFNSRHPSLPLFPRYNQQQFLQ